MSIDFRDYFMVKTQPGWTIRKAPKPPVPAKPNVLYSRGKFVDMVCWTVG